MRVCLVAACAAVLGLPLSAQAPVARPGLQGGDGPALVAQECATIPTRGNVAVRSDTSCLSLDQAVARAIAESPGIKLARSNTRLADATVRATLSTGYPKIDGNISYTRTFASPYSISKSGGDTTSTFDPDTTASLAERVRYLEKNSNIDFGSLFGDLPFGQANAYTFSLTGSETLYSGGKGGALGRIATAYRDAAQLQVEEQASAIEFAVKQAYYGALLAQSLDAIATASVEQATAFLTQVRLLFDAGKASDLETMRAEVALDNLRPQAVQAQNAASLATLELKRLLDLPMDLPLRLTTPLAVPPSVGPSEVPADQAAALEQRPSLQAQQRQVAIQTDQLVITRAAHRPRLELSMAYGKLLYPARVFGFGGETWRTNWTSTLSLSVPIFAGFSKAADMDKARINLEMDQTRLTDLKAAVQVEYQQALGEQGRAASAITARQRTVDQARRVHDLTVLRFENGLSTQLEVADARLGLLQARTNLAQATADYLLAEAQVARALGRSSAARSIAR